MHCLLASFLCCSNLVAATAVAAEGDEGDDHYIPSTATTTTTNSFHPNSVFVFPFSFRRIQLAKTDACLLSRFKRVSLAECPLPVHFLRQIFKWMPLRGALRLGLTCKGLFTLYRSSLATDRRSLVLNNGCYYGFEEDTDISPFFADHLRTLLFSASNRVQLVNSAADEECYFYNEEDVPLLSWGDRLFRSCLPRLTGLTSLTLIIDHELAKNMAQLSTALFQSVAATRTTSTTTTSSSPPLPQLTTLKMICYLELIPAKEEEKKKIEKDFSAIVPLQLPALTHLTLSLHCPKENDAYKKALLTGSSTVNAFRIFFSSPLLFVVLRQLSSLQLHSDIFAGKLIRCLCDLLWRVPQLQPTPAMMSSSPPALQLSFNLLEEDDLLMELVEQLLFSETGVAAGPTSAAALAKTKLALASVVQLQVSSKVDSVCYWPIFNRLLSALFHLKRLALTFDPRPDGHYLLLPQLDILDTLTALSFLPHLEELKVYGSHPSNASISLQSRPDLLPFLPVLASLRRLELHVYAASCEDDQVEHFQLVPCFPRLEELKLVVTLKRSVDGRCERHRCRQPPPPPHSADDALSNGCFRQLFASLLHCPAVDLQTPTGRWVKALRKKEFSVLQ